VRGYSCIDEAEVREVVEIGGSLGFGSSLRSKSRSCHEQIIETYALLLSISFFCPCASLSCFPIPMRDPISELTPLPPRVIFFPSHLIINLDVGFCRATSYRPDGSKKN
jgi:hypothetical protein